MIEYYAKRQEEEEETRGISRGEKLMIERQEMSGGRRGCEEEDVGV